MLINNIKFALSSLWSNKIRSSLTMLGVIIGVFSVITLISIGEGLRDEFANQISDIGSNLVIVASGQIDTQGQELNIASLVGQSSLTLEDVDAVKEEVGNMEEIAWTINLAGQVTYEDKISRSSINFATQPSIMNILNYDLDQGRGLTDQDLEDNARVVVIGGGIKELLFPDQEDIVDEKINLLNEEFTVIGAWESKESAISMGGMDFNNIIVMPFTTGEEIAGNSDIFRILIQVDHPENVAAVSEGVNKVISEKHGDTEDFSVMTQDDLMGLFDSFFGILTQAISGIAAISLIVGGIGIMNIMLVSVTERTKEIGTRKALGATSLNILTQFLVESATLSMVGGGLGVGLSYLVGQLITQYIDIPTVITLQGLLLAICISLAVGIIFGLMPAIKASQKSPIEALRYE